MDGQIDGWISHSCRVAALQKSLGTLQIFDLNLLNPDKKGKIERQLMGFNTKKVYYLLIRKRDFYFLKKSIKELICHNLQLVVAKHYYI